jgi:pimeloyl-ACP methyl ester carboxylesterase
MSTAQFGQLRALAVPKRVVFGVNDPQMSASDAAATARSIGAPPPTFVPGRHLTMISSPQEVASAIQALIAP